VYNIQTGIAIKEISDTYVTSSYPRPQVFGKYHTSIGSRIRVMDLENFDVTVSPTLKDLGVDQYILNYDENYLYLAAEGFHFPTKTIIKRIRIDNLGGPIETVVEDSWPTDVLKPRNTRVFGLAFQKNVRGQKILYYGSSQSYSDTLNFKSRSTYNAYNLDTKKYEWQFKFDDGVNGGQVPYFYKDKLILISLYDITAFDTASGKLVWKKSFNHLSGEDYAVIDNLLFISEHNGKLFKINIENGDALSSLQLPSLAQKGWQLHNNRLYFVSSFDLLSIDLAKMSIEWQWNRNIPEFGWPSFRANAPVIDKKTNRLFIADSRDMFCIKIPD
jgi:hypothetical protein